MRTATVFVGPAGVAAYQVIVLRSALKLYRDTGMRANRAYTPTAMMKLTRKLTGKKLKARDYTGAIDALTDLLKDQGA